MFHNYESTRGGELKFGNSMHLKKMYRYRTVGKSLVGKVPQSREFHVHPAFELGHLTSVEGVSFRHGLVETLQALERRFSTQNTEKTKTP